MNEELKKMIIDWLKESLVINMEYKEFECNGKELDVSVSIGEEVIVTSHVDLY